MSEADRSLAHRSEQHHGVFTRAEALEAGLTDGQIDWRVASGRWERVQPKTFRVAGAPLTWWGRLRAATAAAERPVAVSHGTALQALGLDATRPSGRIEVTTTDAGPLCLGGVVVHRSRTLEPRDVRSRDGVPVTTPERTIVDVAGRLSPAVRYRLVDEAICAGVTRRGRLHARAVELRSGRAGVSSVAAITADGARGEFRSFLERAADRAIRHSDLPQPAWNWAVRKRGRMLAVLDAFWEHAPLGAEFDGLRFHLPPARRAKDVTRDRRLLIEAAIPVIRFTYVEVMEEPEVMVSEIRRALRSRAVSSELGRTG